MWYGIKEADERKTRSGGFLLSAFSGYQVRDRILFAPDIIRETLQEPDPWKGIKWPERRNEMNTGDLPSFFAGGWCHGSSFRCVADRMLIDGPVLEVLSGDGLVYGVWELEQTEATAGQGRQLTTDSSLPRTRKHKALSEKSREAENGVKCEIPPLEMVFKHALRESYK